MTVECDILFHARLHWVCVLPPLYQGGGVALSYIHPDPLPKGEGTAGSEQWKADQRVWILRGEWFTLSPRERAGVRGKQPGHAAARMASPWRAANARRAGWL